MKKKDIGFLFLSCVSCVLVILGIFHCLDVYQGYQYGRDEYISLNRRYTRVTEKDIPKTSKKETELIREDDVVEAPQDAPESLNIDWDELKQINSDIIAWIQIPAVNLSYPVLQGEDNDYYLHRDFYKSYLYAGSIFLDCNNNADFLNYNSIVYGHNMLDQSMFARLKEFNDSDILQQCPYIWIITPGKQNLYAIFSVHETVADGDSYVISMQSQEEYDKWLQKMKLSSSIDTGTDVTSGDKVLTLSTCTNNGMTRQVVQAKLIYSNMSED